MDIIDKLTLELFTNKTQYRKYLSKNEPENYRILVEKREKYEKYKTDILERTKQILSVPDLLISSLVQETFENYVDVLIKEIETNKLEVKDFEKQEDDEDILFPENHHWVSHKKFPSPILKEIDTTEEKKTFWSKDTHTHTDTTYDGIFNHYPTNSAVRKRFIGRRNSYVP